MEDRLTYRTHADIADDLEDTDDLDPVAGLSPRDALLAERLSGLNDVLAARDLRGRPVVVLTEGRRAGTVSDVLLDPAGEKVVGLTVDRPGVFAGQSFLPFYHIRAIGDDAVTVHLEEAIEPPLSPQAARGTVSVRETAGKRVITAGGEAAGASEDVLFHRGDGRIGAYVLGSRGYLLWTRGLRIGEDVIIIPNDATAFVLEDRGGFRATREDWLNKRMGGRTMQDERNLDNTGTMGTAASDVAGDAARDDRLDSEFQYVIGHVTQRDVVVDGQVVVPANTQVTAADATSALAAGVLEDLAFAVGMGDPSKTDVHSMPDDVEGTMQPESVNQTGYSGAIDEMPATGTMAGTDQPTGTAGRVAPEDAEVVEFMDTDGAVRPIEPRNDLPPSTV